MAEEAEAHLEGAGRTEWVGRIARDYPNLCAALVWSRDQGDTAALARMGASLAMFWWIRGPLDEGLAWLDAVLAVTDGVTPALRVKALYGRALVGNMDSEIALARAEEGLHLARQLEDDRLTARTLATLGFVRNFTGHPGTVAEEAVALARQIDDRWALWLGLWVVSGKYRIQDPGQGRPYLEEMARVAQESGDRGQATVSSAMLGAGLWSEGEFHQARQILEENLRVAQEFDRSAVTTTLSFLARVLVDMDQRAAALESAVALEAAIRAVGGWFYEHLVPDVRGRIALSNGDLQAALRYGCDALALAANPLGRAEALGALVETELTAGMTVQSRIHLNELITVAESADFGHYRSAALVLKARLGRREGDLASAENAGHGAMIAATSAKARVVDAVEVLGGVVADLDSPEEAARLFGSAQGIRDATGYARCVSERDADIAALEDKLGPESLEAEYDQGRALSLDDAVAYVRRGRGERKRPSTGWASLSPAENHVARLTAGGLTNQEIAERLFCSPRTVQSHLTHIYAKLGVASRGELAAQAGRRPG